MNLGMAENIKSTKTGGKRNTSNVKKIRTAAATITITGVGSDDSDSSSSEDGDSQYGTPSSEAAGGLCQRQVKDDLADDGQGQNGVKEHHNANKENEFSNGHYSNVSQESKASLKTTTPSDTQCRSSGNCTSDHYGASETKPLDAKDNTASWSMTNEHTEHSATSIPWEKLSIQQQQLYNENCDKNHNGALNTSGSSEEWDPQPHRQGKHNESITNAELGLAEDHFAIPEGHFGMSTTEELEMAISNCKKLILEATEHTERRRSLVNKLVQLRMRLQDAKEGPVEEEPEIKQVVGHRFKQRISSSSKHYCEKCTRVIWGVLQTWYKCLGCGFCCHESCLNLITRTCASVKVLDNPQYILSICPEKGLAAQNFRCAECRTPISHIKSKGGEPRQCDYTGQFYCEQCHWNDMMVIPARLLHNWDLDMHRVCRASKQFLRLMLTRPVLRIQDINPMLFSFVDELNEVRKLREELLVMKKYFLSCKAALESKLLLQLQERQHFVDSSDMYSLQDLIDIAYDILLPELAKIHTSFAQHIKTDCQLCQAKGYICELCDAKEVLFPFDNIAIVCAQCSTVLHRHCYIRKNHRCPKCERLNKRAGDQASTSTVSQSFPIL